MSKQTKRYRTQWASQFYAAAELTRRGYLVSLTFGNAHVADLLVQSEDDRMFTVDVKGQSTKNFWLIQPRPIIKNHYYIFVYLPRNGGDPSYFVASCEEVMNLRNEYKKRMIEEGKKYDDKLGGFNWTDILPYENRWEILKDS